MLGLKLPNLGYLLKTLWISAIFSARVGITSPPLSSSQDCIELGVRFGIQSVSRRCLFLLHIGLGLIHELNDDSLQGLVP